MSEQPGGLAAGVVLAAGEGKRFGGPKAPFEINGERLVDRSVRVLRDAGCSPIVVVLGAWQGSVDGAVVVVNGGWQEGMASSLRAALKWLQVEADTDHALITLVDLPGLTPQAVRRVLEAPAGIAVATYGGERGHPVRIPREHFHTLIETVSGDEGARSFLAGREDITFVEVGDIASGLDLDYAITD